MQGLGLGPAPEVLDLRGQDGSEGRRATVLVLDRVLQSGRATRQEVTFRGGRAWSVSAPGGGSEDVLASDLVTVLARSSNLTRLPLGEMRTYTADQSRLSLDALLSVLRPTGGLESEGGEWMHEDASYFNDQDEQLSDDLPGVQFVHRWVQAFGRRVTGIVRRGGVDVVALDHVGEGLEEKAVVAEGSWFSEAGGAPISWDVGSSLTRLSRNLCLSRTWGDQDPGIEVIEWPASAQQRIAVLASWIQNVGFDASAAIALEPLDPRGTLTPAQRARWMALVNGLTMDLSVWLPAVDALRRRLMRNSEVYAAVTKAMRSPKGAVGARLFNALASCVESGVMGEVMFFGQ